MVGIYTAVVTLQAVNHKITITISPWWNVWEHKTHIAGVFYCLTNTNLRPIAHSAIIGIQNIRHSGAQERDTYLHTPTILHFCFNPHCHCNTYTFAPCISLVPTCRLLPTKRLGIRLAHNIMEMIVQVPILLAFD